MANLPSLPPLPGKGRAKAPQKCGCGCGDLTRGGRFLPGHDAIRLAWAIRLERGIVTAADIPHDGIRKAATAFVAERAKAAKKTA